MDTTELQTALEQLVSAMNPQLNSTPAPALSRRHTLMRRPTLKQINTSLGACDQHMMIAASEYSLEFPTFSTFEPLMEAPNCFGLDKCVI
jgi:hypothetical protein